MQGRAFKVHDPDEFMKMLPKYCIRQTKFRSFQRQLNIYGFRQMKNKREGCGLSDGVVGSYFHKRFIRGDLMSCSKIRPPPSTNIVGKTAAVGESPRRAHAQARQTGSRRGASREAMEALPSYSDAMTRPVRGEENPNTSAIPLQLPSYKALRRPRQVSHEYPFSLSPAEVARAPPTYANRMIPGDDFVPLCLDIADCGCNGTSQCFIITEKDQLW